jgi:MOSC domain-containing protein YiiM
MGLLEPHGRHGRGDGPPGVTGRIAGIARHSERRGPVETLASVRITPEGGVEGDRNGGKTRRQVSLIEGEGWVAAMAECGGDLPWWERRANLLVEGFDLPRREGARVRVGDDVVLEIKCEIDPCERMEELQAGLRDALAPDWRGGAGAQVIVGGIIAIGDAVRIEE